MKPTVPSEPRSCRRYLTCGDALQGCVSCLVHNGAGSQANVALHKRSQTPLYRSGSERSMPTAGKIGTSPNTKPSMRLERSNAKLNFRGFLTLGCWLEFPYLLRFPQDAGFWIGSCDNLQASYRPPTLDMTAPISSGLGLGLITTHGFWDRIDTVFCDCYEQQPPSRRQRLLANWSRLLACFQSVLDLLPSFALSSTLTPTFTHRTSPPMSN